MSGINEDREEEQKTVAMVYNPVESNNTHEKNCQLA
jgi:hypothetical protein